MQEINEHDLRGGCSKKYRPGLYDELVYIDPVEEGHLYEDEIKAQWGESVADFYRETGLARLAERRRRREPIPRAPIDVTITVVGRTGERKTIGETSTLNQKRTATAEMGTQTVHEARPHPPPEIKERPTTTTATTMTKDSEPGVRPPAPTARKNSEVRTTTTAAATTNNTEVTAPSPTGGVKVLCYNCHRSGHVGARCPLDNNRICGWCCHLGHLQLNCDKKDSPPPTPEEARQLRIKNEDEILRRISRGEATMGDLERAKRRHYNN